MLENIRKSQELVKTKRLENERFRTSWESVVEHIVLKTESVFLTSFPTCFLHFFPYFSLCETCKRNEGECTDTYAHAHALLPPTVILRMWFEQVVNSA